MRPREFFAELPDKANPERIAGVEHAYLFDVEGEGRWLVDIRDGKVTVTESPDGEGDVQFSMSGDTFDRITARKQNPMVAYMTGKVKVTGDIRAAMYLQNIL
jgi:putative sterol carrier protein